MHAFSRRALLAGVGASLALPAIPGQAQAADRIDIHHHVASPLWLQAVGAKNEQPPGFLQNLREWTPARMVEEMDRAGTAKGIVSPTAPGVWMGDVSESIRLARDANEYAAKVVAQYPKRFGFWAVLPMRSADASLREIAYSFDTLKADGVSIFASYGDKYLGDPSYDPIFAELDRRKAVAFIHPGNPACCRGLVHGIPDSVIEGPADTARTLAGYVFSGASQRYPNVRIIFVHAGGVMPSVNERLTLLAKTAQYQKVLPNGFLPEVAKLYFDTATVSNAASMAALRRLVPASRIFFGTDFPNRHILDQVQALDTGGVFTAAELEEIYRTNALALVPRLES